MYAFTHRDVHGVPREFFRTDEEIAVAKSLSKAETFAAAEEVMRAYAARRDTPARVRLAAMSLASF